ncbi:2-isopropylmalate synthase [Marinomonas mediterranea]|uniref:2-isopropylmalate synthase n=1 Tax=Marinomonas mediterranea (strain ATCC 700492 / JCM 21426 / NBRC 103028 / MMB-1) TaxID=717774 RepID=F2K3G3_MARM1|nr:2-isopropylmalate synthase [Marinomonas mediterranea]ADZ91305.1 2-isopropylmalate synthase [Marinomonas mediterranea MMB-1]WCN09276.1 2-isopropylmalate synthase [Marinomonas mediterranea]WCN13358.1 2-isopropylmalate synthase [Marinomonas mediterranea]WCN17426.1 2-isopropylmalate synthase [Marinomonas mediterranea MMB-1]
MTSFDHTKYRPFQPVAIENRTWPDQEIKHAPKWCSVDLRDGNQALVEPMTVEQKKQFFALLVDVGFKEIEVGFPAASQLDFDFVRWLIEENQVPDDVYIQVLTQARPELIERTYESLKGAKKAVVHVYNSTSKTQREQVFRLDKDGIKNIAVNGAKCVLEHATKHPETEWVFQYSPESFTGTETDYAVEVCNAVIDVWQPTPQKKCIINLPATVEVTTPNRFADQIEYFCRHVNKRDSIEVSLHTHNDRGCGVAAAELGMMAGADRIEGTLLGNGERTGNMDVVTMAMNIYSQGVDPKLALGDMDRIVSVVQACTQLPVHPRHPYAGELVFTAFSGSHQDAIKKCLAHQQDDQPWDVAYLPIDPTDVGRSYQEVIRVNSQSGKGGMAYTLEQEYGLALPRWLQVEFSPIVQRFAEEDGGVIDAEAMKQLFESSFLTGKAPYSLGRYELSKSENDTVHAELIDNGEVVQVSGQGNGALSAFGEALGNYFDLKIDIVQYQEHALTVGSDAQAIAYVQANINGERFNGAAIDNDIVSASIQALLATLNQKVIAAKQANVA